MHGKCILAPKAPVFLQCDTQFLLLDFIGVICGFRCYSVHELSTDWLNKGILMNEPKLASIFRLMRLSECIAAIPPQKPKKKKNPRHDKFNLVEHPKSYLIYETLTFIFFFIVFQELNRISQISAENDFIIIIFFNNISIHSKVTSGYFAALLGLRIYNIKLLYTFRSIRTREEKLLKCKNSCFILPVFHWIISFLQFCGSWWSLSLGYLWLVSVSFFGFFFSIMLTIWIFVKKLVDHQEI